MALFTQKVHRRLGGDYTFLVLTDRTDLDNQIYKTFTSVGLANTDKDPCRAGSAQQLRDLLGQQKKVIFGMIQKFTDDQAKGGVYATRDNIIVMTLWSVTEGLNFDLTKHLRPYVMRNLTMSAFHLLHEQRKADFRRTCSICIDRKGQPTFNASATVFTPQRHAGLTGCTPLDTWPVSAPPQWIASALFRYRGGISHLS